MYKQYFNFTTEPFSISPDPFFIYMSDQHQEGLAHLLYGINHGCGFVVLTGEVGTGKTTLCHCLLEQLPENIDIALILNPKLNTVELLASICDELQVTYDKDDFSLKGLIDELNQHLLTVHANSIQTVLIIDEAQNLGLDVLEQIRLLTNLETSKTKLLQIILIGQPELKQILEKPALRQLNQRVTARYHLVPLAYSETEKYIKHRLSICGGLPEIFATRAIKSVYKLSKGIPRVINVLCDKALLGAYTKGEQSVSAKTVNQAAKEVLTSYQSSENNYLTKGLLALLMLTLPIVAYTLFNKLDEKKVQPQTIAIQEDAADLKINSRQQLFSNDFSTSLVSHNYSLNTTISMLSKKWDKKVPQDFSCDELELLGLMCFFGKTDWNNLIALNRPLVMEFSVSGGGKAYALLSGVKQGNPVLQFENKEITFPLAHVLSQWNGYYLVLWKSPMEETKIIYPGQSSRAVLWIRKHLTLTPDFKLSTRYSILFDDELKAEITNFQMKRGLTQDGIVGPQTFIHLRNNDIQDNSPKLKVTL